MAVPSLKFLGGAMVSEGAVQMSWKPVINPVFCCSTIDANTTANSPFCNASRREVGVLCSWYPWFFYH